MAVPLNSRCTVSELLGHCRKPVPIGAGGLNGPNIATNLANVLVIVAQQKGSLANLCAFLRTSKTEPGTA